MFRQSKMIIPLLVLAVTLYVLVKSSDAFVDAAARIAKYFGVSEFVIGLTLVSIGTTLPELSTSAMATLQGHPNIALGNGLGSVIFNTGVILGMTAIFISAKVEKRTLFRDCALLMVLPLLLSVFCLDGTVSTLEGVILLLIAFANTLHLLKFRPRVRARVYQVLDYLHQKLHLRPLHPPAGKKARAMFFKKAIVRDFTVLGFSLLGIIVSSKLMVSAAVEIALGVGVTTDFIGVTLVAAGTSLPELFVAISAIRKKLPAITIGNIIGANILDLTAVIGLSASLAPLTVPTIYPLLTIPFTFFMAAGLFSLVLKDGELKRYGGAMLLALYVVFFYLLMYSGA